MLFFVTSTLKISNRNYLLLVNLLFIVFLQICDATQPCSLSILCPSTCCCGKNGICGTGNDYCGVGNCLNQCPIAATAPPPPLPNSPPPPAYRIPPPLPYYYYSPPYYAFPFGQERHHSIIHGVGWWLGITAAIVAILLLFIIICILIAKSAKHRGHECNCECA